MNKVEERRELARVAPWPVSRQSVVSGGWGAELEPTQFSYFTRHSLYWKHFRQLHLDTAAVTITGSVMMARPVTRRVSVTARQVGGRTRSNR